MLIWSVGIHQIINTAFASCRKHFTTSRYDVTMWRHATHAIVWNWSNTSMTSVFTCQLTRFTYILLNCCILSSQDKLNEICDIVTRRHGHDVTAWSKVIMPVLMLWHFLIKQRHFLIKKQPCIHGQRSNHLSSHSTRWYRWSEFCDVI